MTRFTHIVFGIASTLLLHSCSEILEPVSLVTGKQKVDLESSQEDFDIKIAGLTFANAKKANNAPYSRQVMLRGSGSSANVYDESYFLELKAPKSSNSLDYKLGVGDEFSFLRLDEFETENVQWPANSKKSDYILGIGDQLTFVQSNDLPQRLMGTFNGEGQFNPTTSSDNLITTTGIIGSNGNILLFGLGNIIAAGRTLGELRTDIRNILIRNGLAPNFQLEISDFKSQKAYVSISNAPSAVITLNNLPISLKEVAIGSGLSATNQNLSLITLTRNSQNFRVTAGQLFSLDAPEILIEDKDQIEIKSVEDNNQIIKIVVGSKGYILLSGVGRIRVENQTIEDIRVQISKILIAKGIKPNFQLELTKAANKEAYLIQKDVGSKIIPLGNSKITLRELILESEDFLITSQNLTVVTLKRNDEVFHITGDRVLDPNTPSILVVHGDQIEVDNLAYKPGKVFVLSGTDSAQIVAIDPSVRETLADVLFVSDGPLNNRLVKRSEVYLLRDQNPSIAYHLDAQNVSRILVADTMQLRPNDIIYVAERPIVSFTRTLSEINPLRSLLRDLEEGKIP
jgi:protein involved in polysaccharide export with SLBB domain